MLQDAARLVSPARSAAVPDARLARALRVLTAVVAGTLCVLVSGGGASWFAELDRRAVKVVDPERQRWLLGLSAVLLVVLMGRVRAVWERLRHEPWAVAVLAAAMGIVGWAWASAGWSVDPRLTTNRAAALAASLLVGLFLAAEYRVADAIRLVCAALLAAGVASFLTEWFLDRAQGSVAGWRGIYANSAGLGAAASLALVLSVASLAVATSFRHVGLALASIVVHLFALHEAARSGPAALLGVGLLTAVILLVKGASRLGGVRGAPLLSTATGLGLLLPAALAALVTRFPGVFDIFVGNAATWRARSRVWHQARELATRGPAKGIGYGAALPPSALSERIAENAGVGLPAGGVRNSFLDVWIGLGWVGLVLLFGLLSCVAVAVLRAPRTTWAATFPAGNTPAGTDASGSAAVRRGPTAGGPLLATLVGCVILAAALESEALAAPSLHLALLVLLGMGARIYVGTSAGGFWAGASPAGAVPVHPRRSLAVVSVIIALLTTANLQAQAGGWRCPLRTAPGAGSPPVRDAALAPTLLADISLRGLSGASRAEGYETRVDSLLRLRLRITNRGNEAWTVGLGAPVRVGVHLLDREGRLVTTEFARASFPPAVPTLLSPGQAMDVGLDIAAPARKSSVLEVDVVWDGRAWFAQHGSTTLRLPMITLC